MSKKCEICEKELPKFKSKYCSQSCFMKGRCTKQREYYKNHKEMFKISMKKWYEKGGKEKMHRNFKRWYENNREKHLKKMAEYYKVKKREKENG